MSAHLCVKVRNYHSNFLKDLGEILTDTQSVRSSLQSLQLSTYGPLLLRLPSAVRKRLMRARRMKMIFMMYGIELRLCRCRIGESVELRKGG
jgi:hypothetical protein